MVRNQTFRRDVLDRATAKIEIPPLYQRQTDIVELAQLFALEAAKELNATHFYGFSRQSKADIEAAVLNAQEVSVRHLREMVRNAVFLAASVQLPHTLESDFLKPLLHEAFAYTEQDRTHYEITQIEDTFDALIGMQRLEDIAQRHGVSAGTLRSLCQAIQKVIQEMASSKPRSYRNVLETTHRLSKVALWIISGAHTQAQFRRFFGHMNADMPTKSVAHQIFYDVFPNPKKSVHPL
jgi:DNA-binding NtrC family response regulator